MNKDVTFSPTNLQPILYEGEIAALRRSWNEGEDDHFGWILQDYANDRMATGYGSDEPASGSAINQLMTIRNSCPPLLPSLPEFPPYAVPSPVREMVNTFRRSTVIENGRTSQFRLTE